MAIQIAKKTLAAIEAAIEQDQGTKYRQALAYLLPKMEDAYRASGDPHRSHFGFSSAGKSCGRSLWYSFRWAKRKYFTGRILRLFNRGHLEEARFLAALITAGFEVYFETENGGQFRISDHGGHSGSALDGVVIGIPDLPPNTPALTEMKTHGVKSFASLKSKGVQVSKPEHYVQMQIYMHKYELSWALYLAVEKDTDELYAEIIQYHRDTAIAYIDRVGTLIFQDQAPSRIQEDPSWYECKYCEYVNLCFFNEVPEINCRTCTYVSALPDGTWSCSKYSVTLSKDNQLSGCESHLYNPYLLNANIIDGDTDAGWLKISWKEYPVVLGTGEGQMTSKEFYEANA